MSLLLQSDGKLYCNLCESFMLNEFNIIQAHEFLCEKWTKDKMKAGE